MKVRRTLAVLAALALLCALCACGEGAGKPPRASGGVLTLSDGGSGADAAGVRVSGDTVTITAGGTWRVGGSLSRGRLRVDCGGEAELVLTGVSITNPDGPALEIVGGSVRITLAEGSENVLVSGGPADAKSPAEEASGAALRAKGSLAVDGFGSLRVFGYINNGIAAGSLSILGGTVAVTAANHGLKGSGGVAVSGGTVSVSAAADGFHSDGDILICGGCVTVEAGDEGLSADGEIGITDGLVTVARSREGAEGHRILVSGGSLSVEAEDDGLNAGGGPDLPLLCISGGSVYVNAGGDGLDSNGDLRVEGGSVTVDGPEKGDGALDPGRENGGSMTVDGGTVLALGAAEAAETFDPASAQCSFRLYLPADAPAGTELAVEAGDGTVLCRYVSAKAFGSVVFSSPALSPGEEVAVAVGSERFAFRLDGVSVTFGSAPEG